MSSKTPLEVIPRDSHLLLETIEKANPCVHGNESPNAASKYLMLKGLGGGMSYRAKLMFYAVLMIISGVLSIWIPLFLFKNGKLNVENPDNLLFLPFALLVVWIIFLERHVNRERRRQNLSKQH